ncbi:hypothetical protein V5T82_04460 [Magnetovibrio sp. PR-2]|uniref:hypothetical protein n=1 Tax=Magnetovibrio sp. PR-2 TaxID=3120356 RepID=UPI002FCE1F36
MSSKSILVMGRRDHTEAMRVAAGLTICGNDVRLVLMTEPVAETQENAEQVELLELSDITPETTVKEMSNALDFLNADDLGQVIAQSDCVISI